MPRKTRAAAKTDPTAQDASTEEQNLEPSAVALPSTPQKERGALRNITPNGIEVPEAVPEGGGGEDMAISKKKGKKGGKKKGKKGKVEEKIDDATVDAVEVGDVPGSEVKEGEDVEEPAVEGAGEDIERNGMFTHNATCVTIADL